MPLLVLLLAPTPEHLAAWPIHQIRNDSLLSAPTIIESLGSGFALKLLALQDSRATVEEPTITARGFAKRERNCIGWWLTADADERLTGNLAICWTRRWRVLTVIFIFIIIFRIVRVFILIFIDLFVFRWSTRFLLTLTTPPFRPRFSGRHYGVNVLHPQGNPTYCFGIAASTYADLRGALLDPIRNEHECQYMAPSWVSPARDWKKELSERPGGRGEIQVNPEGGGGQQSEKEQKQERVVKLRIPLYIYIYICHIHI